jgi:hypothetical protein
MYNNLEPKDLFVKCKFKETQLEAMRQIYYKHFAPYMTRPYAGKAIVAIWEKDGKWTPTEGKDKNHSNNGFVAEECRLDPSWQEFADLLPYMSQSASITKITPGATMSPHVDRKWRPQAIYFPIEGCTELCISEYFNLPKFETQNNIVLKYHPPATHSYSVYGNAYLTNVHEWHGVRNLSSVERIAVGWNFKSPKLSYDHCKEILRGLGYVDE